MNDSGTGERTRSTRQPKRGDGGCLCTWLAVFITATIVGSCILTDKDIFVETGARINKHPVRLVEPLKLSGKELCSCEDAKKPGSCEPQCPLPRGTGLPHFLDPRPSSEYVFCECEPDEFDANQLSPLEFFAEDEDAEGSEGKNRTVDPIYAALLLDWPHEETAADYVAYRGLHKGRFLDDGSDYDRSVIDRLDPQTRRLVVGDERVDLCNEHGLGDKKMGQSFHTLTLLVTDRPWFATQQPESNDPLPRIGVPDIGAGATWDRLDYVFYCSDKLEIGADATADPYDCTAQCVKE